MLIIALPALLACASTPTPAASDAVQPTSADAPGDAPGDAPTPDGAGPIKGAEDLVLERPPNQGAPGADLSAYGDGYHVVEAPSIKGSTITTKVRYGGGCGEHTWTVKPSSKDNSWKLVHDAGGDLCKAFLFAEARVNIASEGVSLCGRDHVMLEVAMGPDGNPNASFKLPIDEALSQCEGIVPDGGDEEL